MGANQLCGLGDDEGGNYTTEGITELCKGLKGSVITSLAGCAAAPCSALYIIVPLFSRPRLACLDYMICPFHTVPACTHSMHHNRLDQDAKEAIQEAFEGRPANLQL